jgi:lipoprotein-releasing system ATP-binding protein
VSADAVFTLLRKVSHEQGTSVLFVTHNPELAAKCDSTIEVVDGRVVRRSGVRETGAAERRGA